MAEFEIQMLFCFSIDGHNEGSAGTRNVKFCNELNCKHACTFTYNNQLDALFILGLLNYHTSTCFGRINSSSSGGKLYKGVPKIFRTGAAIYTAVVVAQSTR
jgi:hypothetical protein